MASDNLKQPLRILQVVGSMDAGGVETWLMHVLRRIDRKRYRIDFLMHTDESCFYEDEIRSLGSRIFRCSRYSSPVRYASAFRRIVKENGPYDIVHSHVHHFSGYVMLLARWAGVATRITHSHSDTSSEDARAGFRRRLYLRTMERLIRSHSTTGLTCSKSATDFFGVESKSRPRVLYCGINLDPFLHPVDRREVRGELGIPPEAFVLGHVGRFAPQKNHDFLLDVFAEVERREPNARLLLVGEGPLRESIEQKARRLGLHGKVIFAGMRPDVPRLMLGAMDVFILPSHYEGLALVMMEVQAAGLPAVIADTISREGVLDPRFVQALSLHIGAPAWAQAVLNGFSGRRPVSESARAVGASKFNIVRSADELCGVYAS